MLMLTFTIKIILRLNDVDQRDQGIVFNGGLPIVKHVEYVSSKNITGSVSMRMERDS